MNDTWLAKIQEKLDAAPDPSCDEIPDMGQDSPGPMFCTIQKGNECPMHLKDLYRGSACFLIAGGPSFEKMDKDAIRKAGILTMGLNNSPKGFRPDLWLCVDEPARFLESIWRDPKIMKFCGMGKWKKRIWDHDKWEYSKTLVQECPNVIHFRRNSHFQADKFLTEPTVNWGNHKDYGGGRSCFVAALKIMYELGIRRVYLLGVDFRMSEDYTYHFKEQRAKGAVKNNNVSYLRMLSYFTQLMPQFVKAGFSICNCTPQSGLMIFPFLKMEDAVARETSNMPNPETEKTFSMYVPNR